jgi:palmitoyltransferase ZDHHC9/14/18
MSSREGMTQPNAGSNTDDGFPQFPQYPRSDLAGPPSIISSRMTDIASEDGGDREAQASTGGQRRSTLVSEGQSRPGTARTGATGRGPWPQGAPLRRGLSGKGKRGSVSGSISGSTVGGRPVSSASRSHVPSLTSHAFFHPMNAQKLQAQRGMASRPSTMARQMMTQDNAAADETGNNTARHSLASNPVAQLANKLSDEGEAQPPPSRGTEITEHETYDRVTANTSPTQGHYAPASLTESMRPLQKKAGERGLAVDVDKAYKPGGNLPTPSRTPRSFRSSFLLPSRNGSGSNREMQGGEKLESVASSPQFPQQRSAPKPVPKLEKSKLKLGHNYEYFEGNTVFCIGGRLQNTRDRPINIGTGLAVVLPCVLFFVFSAPWIWDNISPAIPITFAYVFYVSISSFIHASASDPGVSVIRNLHRGCSADCF